jgi:hypothetical protein
VDGASTNAVDVDGASTNAVDVDGASTNAVDVDGASTNAVEQADISTAKDQLYHSESFETEEIQKELQTILKNDEHDDLEKQVLQLNLVERVGQDRSVSEFELGDGPTNLYDSTTPLSDVAGASSGAAFSNKETPENEEAPITNIITSDYSSTEQPDGAHTGISVNVSALDDTEDGIALDVDGESSRSMSSESANHSPDLQNNCNGRFSAGAYSNSDIEEDEDSPDDAVDAEAAEEEAKDHQFSQSFEHIQQFHYEQHSEIIEHTSTSAKASPLVEQAPSTGFDQFNMGMDEMSPIGQLAPFYQSATTSSTSTEVVTLSETSHTNQDDDFLH